MADDQKKNKDAKEGADPELEALMQNALEEMLKTSPPNESNGTEVATAPERVPAPEGFPAGIPPLTMLTEELIRQTAQEFDTALASLVGGQDSVPAESGITQENIARAFSRLAGAANQAFNPTNESAAENVAPNMSETLNTLGSNLENMGQPFTDEDLMTMFTNMTTEGNAENIFVPFMQGMMQTLLSKDVLYPSLKEMLVKYPKYLEDNKATLPEADYEKYVKQKEVMEEVCQLMESESDNDTEDEKRERFNKIFDLMQKLPELGKPPKEIAGDVMYPMPPEMLSQDSDTSNCPVM